MPNRRIPVVPPFPRPDPQEQSKAPEAEKEEAESSASGAADSEEFDPSPKDVNDVRLILEEAGNFPPEVADMIIDYAEYWACTTTIADYRSLQGGHLTIRGGRPGEDRFLLRTEPIALAHWKPASQELWRRESKPRVVDPAAEESDFEYPQATLEALAEEPLPDLERPVRKVVFDITSRDQGWSSEPRSDIAYRNSHTWFDAGLERFDRTITCPEDCPDRQDPDYASCNIPTCALRPLWPPSVAGVAGPEAPTAAPAPAQYDHVLHPTPDHCIQLNKLADRTSCHHRVEWRADDDIVPDTPDAEEKLAAIGRGPSTGDGEFVRNLKLGDVITVWGRARYPGWANHVERVEVRVFWAV